MYMSCMCPARGNASFGPVCVSFVPRCGPIATLQKFYKGCSKIFPIMLVSCSMLSESYYAQNYTGIIGRGLGTSAFKVYQYNYYAKYHAQEQEHYCCQTIMLFICNFA